MKLKKELITNKDPKAPISEIFRTLRTNIQFMSTNKKMKTLLITSTFPGEGKSWVASNLAVTFAQAGNKVVLIDADMRKGRQYTIFGVSPRPGLSNYLSGIDETNKKKIIDIDDYIQETPINNLSIIVAGNIPPNPSELLIAPQMEEVLEELKDEYDIIIVDGTPCELVTDAVILSRIVDSTLIVTAYKSTKKDALGRIIKNIQNVGGNLIGVVVNKMPVSTKKYNENYYYSSQNLNGLKQNNIKNEQNIINTENEPKNQNRDREIIKKEESQRTQKINEISKNKEQVEKKPVAKTNTKKNTSKGKNTSKRIENKDIEKINFEKNKEINRKNYGKNKRYIKSN